MVNAGASGTTSQFMSECFHASLPAPTSDDEGKRLDPSLTFSAPALCSFLVLSALCHSQRVPAETDIAFV